MQIRGETIKTFSSGKGITFRLILAEILETLGGSSVRAITTLAQYKPDVALAGIKTALGLLGIPEEAIDEAVQEAGGEAEFFATLDEVNTIGISPAPNLYSYGNSSLGIQPGEYTSNSLWKIGNKIYALDPRGDYSNFIEWVGGIPNLNWVGTVEVWTPEFSSSPAVAPVGASSIVAPSRGLPGDNTTQDKKVQAGGGFGGLIMKGVLAAILAKVLL